MGDQDNIVETIAKEAAEAAKAVVADVKAIAAELTDAVAERTPVTVPANSGDAATAGSNKD